MRMENLVLPKYFETSSPLLALGLLYPTFCITCIVVLIQRIKRRRHEWYIPLERQMDPESFPLNKSGGRQPALQTGQQMPDPEDPSMAASPFPSARDVLRPLSHTTSLPSSGHVAAAILGRRQHDQVQMSPGRSSNSEPQSSPRDSSSEGSSDSGTAAVQSLSGTASLSVSAAAPIEEALRRSPGVSNSNRTQPIQRNETTQILHDVDSEGVRTWKRQIVEYN